MSTPRSPRRLLLALTALLAAASTALAQTPTAFTYQGKLSAAAGAPVNAPTNLRFQLFSAATGGTSLAGPVTRNNVPVTDGLFSTDIDFGSAFQSGNDGWVEIAVVNAQGNATVLSPRQKITPTPLASAIAGVPLVPGAIVTDIDNTASGQDFTINGNAGVTTAYLSFVAGTTGQLTSVTFRVFTNFGPQTLAANVYSGVGVSGALLGSVSQVVPEFGFDPAEFTLDLTSQNIFVTAGQSYSVSVLCNAAFSSTNNPVPGTSGVRSSGLAINWWFRTRVQRPRVVGFAAEAGSAATAISSTTATSATNALTATTAQALNANATSALNDRELRLRSAADANSGLAYFGGANAFRSTGFAPDGPVLFGNLGGGLGTGASNGNIALRWNNAGLVSIGGPISAVNYRLELPNTASPAGQGRANAWVTYSSRTYKHDIQTLADPLSTLSRLRGVQFVWNDALPDGTHKHDIGFIAEEVADAVPDLVTRTPDGAATGLDYGKVVPITVEAIKAQQATLSAQQAEIATLKATNAELKARLDRLEALLKDLR